MEPNDRDFMRRARLAYELGRLRTSAWMVAVAAPPIAWAWLTGRPPSLLAPVGIGLLLLATASAFVHRRYQRAALVGILASIPALLLPWMMNRLGLLQFGVVRFDPCVPSCVVVGAAASAITALWAAREQRHWSFWLVAGVAAGLTSVLGCSVAGSAGLIGLAAGSLLGTVPVLVRAQPGRA